MKHFAGRTGRKAHAVVTPTASMLAIALTLALEAVRVHLGGPRLAPWRLAAKLARSARSVRVVAVDVLTPSAVATLIAALVSNAAVADSA